MHLSPATWPAVSALLDEALALAPEERATWLQSLDGERAVHRETLRALLSQTAAVETGDFLATLPRFTEVAPAGTRGPLTELAAGDAIGPYRLLSELGTGGMGAVWLAERSDGQLKRKVALKLPRMVWAKGLAERMARERDILATLEHPNIARLYDAGVDQHGRPYLALEYVEGQPIDVYARERGLGVKDKLQLLLQVCSAVAFAHSRLVVHRDLKPSNILVTSDGQVRLLDFGIAKLMEGDSAKETQLTQLAGRALTLDYASPEQIKGEPIGTASDVYSLGVVAYELLTGAKPYKLKRGSAAELEEAIATAEPPKASDAATAPSEKKALRGDLDAILNKALKKAAGERYFTVEGLAEDIRRHCNSEPVVARPDRLSYRVLRFVQRYSAQVIGASAVLIALVAGTTAALWQAREAQRQRDLAVAAALAASASAARADDEARKARVAQTEADDRRQEAEAARTDAVRAATGERQSAETAARQARRAEEVKRFVLSAFANADPDAGAGKETRAVDLLMQAQRRIERDLGDGDIRLALELKTALAYSLVGNSALKEAVALLQPAVDRATRELPAFDPLLLEARVVLGEAYAGTGESKRAVETLNQVLPQAERLSNLRPAINARRWRSTALFDLGRPDEAVIDAQAAATLADRPGVDPLDRARAKCSLANASNVSGSPDAVAHALSCVEAMERHYGSARTRAVIDAHIVLGFAESRAGRHQAAAVRLTAAAQDAKALLGPTSVSYSTALNYLFNAQLAAGQFEQAYATVREQLAIEESAAAKGGPTTFNHALTQLNLAVALGGMRQPATADETDKALAMLENAAGADHPLTRNVRSLAATASAAVNRTTRVLALEQAILADKTRSAGEVARDDARLSLAWLRLGDAKKALTLARGAVSTMPSQAPPRAQVVAQIAISSALVHNDLFHEAQPFATSAVQILDAFAQARVDAADMRLVLARINLGLGKPAEAEAVLRHALQTYGSIGSPSRETGLAQTLLSQARARQGAIAEADQLLTSARSLLGANASAADAAALAAAEKELEASRRTK
jgi:hypothetical protein